MKKGIKTLLSLLLVFTSLQSFEDSFVADVSAAGEYPLYCGSSYEVSTANANGTFTKISCASSFSDAMNTMRSNGENAVVRHSSSYSPMKVIAMNAGVAITYPMRSGKITMNIYQDVNHPYRKVTYVTKHREMKYDTTYSYDGNGNGTILVNVTGFAGVTSLKDVDLVPFVFIKNDKTVLLGGNDTTAANEQPFWTHVYQSHYVVKQNGNYKDLVFKAYSGWSGASTYPAEYTLTVGSAADWMNVGDVYYSYDGYTFYSDYKYEKEVGVYYNYYQFLPARSKTSISASTFDNFLLSVKGNNTNSKMRGQGAAFINAQNTYGVNALLVYALACLESAYGTSNYALQRNNLFGWNAFDSDPGQASYFPSVEVAIKEHMGINLRGYLNIDDARFFGSHVGNKGSGFNVKYAADPYWGYKIAAIAYEIDKYANDYSGNLSDDKVDVGVINTYGVDITTGTDGKTVLYNSRYGSTYQENFTVVVLEEGSTWMKIQATNPVANGKIINGSTTGLVNYNWDASVGYISKQYVTNLSSTPSSTVGEEPTGDFVSTVQSISHANGILSLTGEAYRPGIYVTDENKVTQNLGIINQSNKETSVEMTSVVSENDKVKYTAEVDLSQLEIGEYYFKVKTNYSKLIQYSQEFIVRQNSMDLEPVVIDDKEYSFKVVDELVLLTVKEEEKVDTTVKKMLKQDILTYTYDKTTQELEITGYAFISGVDAKETTELTQELMLYNLETAEEIQFDVKTQSLDTPISFNDGYEYTKVLYQATLDMSTVDTANYSINVKVTNGEFEEKAELKNYFTQIKPEDFTENEYQYRFVINQLYGYRYEIQIEKNQVDWSQINKPTVRNSVFDFNSLSLEDEKINLTGVAWIYGADANGSTNPTYQLMLVDEDGEVVEKKLDTIQCEVDYTTMLNLKFDTKNACFDGEVEMVDLPEGKYRLYLEIKTSKYNDIFELYDFYNREIDSYKTTEKEYQLSNSKVRKRFMLDVKKVLE